MRFSSKLLVAVVATASIATTAPSASFALDLLADEASESICSEVTTTSTDVDGGCLVHATSEGTVEVRKHVFGVESHITACTNEFEARVDEDGLGKILEQQMTGGGCSRQACKDGSGEAIPWPLALQEGSPAEGTEFLATTFCVEPISGGTDETCEIDIPFQWNDHDLEFGHATELLGHGISGFRCELVGHWNSEVGDTHDSIAEVQVLQRPITGQVEAKPPTTLDFNNVANEQKTVEFENHTNYDLKMENPAPLITGEAMPRYTTSNGCNGQVLAKAVPPMTPAGKCTFTVTRNAGGAGTPDLTLRVRFKIHPGGNSVRSSDPIILQK